jgi:hypothetical protein
MNCFKDTYDSIAIYNLSILLVSVVHFFIGHEIYRSNSNRLFRIVLFLGFTYFVFKFATKIATPLITHVIVQYEDDKVLENRRQLKEDDDYRQYQDDHREESIQKEKEEEAAKEKELKEFDENFCKKLFN